ncbi:MAG: HAMP domain-containing protein [Ilumatobacter sp.]|nr:HAMP domain-containing protein [Ilumatobacter sp.]
MKLSVTARLTIVVAVLMGALSAAAAVLAPGVVEDALIDDILDASAEEHRFLFDDTDFAFGLDELGLDAESLATDPAVADLVESGDLARLIELGDGRRLVVALGGSSFVAIDDVGRITPFDDDIDAIGQPVLPVLELLRLDPFVAEFAEPGDDGVLTGGLASVDVIVAERTVDGVELIVFGDIASVDRTVGRVRTALWTATPVVMALAAVLTWGLASRALRPVRSITRQAATISAGTLDTRVPVPSSGDEVADLATTFNDMLDRLEADDRRRRQFVSDASHELRTPVAVMRNEAEVALQNPEAAGVAELASAVVAESTRLAMVIDDLLMLARHDERQAVAEGAVDLDDIVLAEAARTRSVAVDATRVSAGRVRGRPEELGRLVGHLIDNAARHAATRVQVALTTSAQAVSLVVDDDGQGVPVAQRTVIFDRFTRLDDARTRDEGGAGLGLAVVASIAARSGGGVAVDDSDLGGARFTVTWPID